MKKKELKAGIEIETVKKTVNITFNKKMIIKGGKIKIDCNNEIPNVSLFDWHIGYKRKRRFLFFRKKMGSGISIKGDSLIISGKSPDLVKITEDFIEELTAEQSAEEFWKNRLPKRKT